MKKEKRTWKRWGLIWPNGELVSVGDVPSLLGPSMTKQEKKRLGIKIKKVTVIEGWVSELKASDLF